MAYWSFFFKHNDLHIVLVIDPSTQSGKQSAFGLSDVLLEAAITAIMDCEDSVSVIDAEDKSRVYAHWSAMMKGELEFKMPNGTVRKMNADKVYRSALDGCEGRISGTGCLFIRNVGIHMFSHAALYKSQPVPEGLLDLLFTGVGGLHDCLGRYNNSKKGSIYIVKPKMHGPEEAAFVVQTFDRLEELLKFPKNTIKLGIMDEERRTSANLKEVLRVANGRVCFINTGFLDRTGDEIHTSFKKKPMMCKDTIKSSVFIPVYERRNVEIGLATCTHENAQIGKGMWAEPDAMANMLKTKIGHPKAGANTAWVPSPTAATLHALHYHQCSVKEVQREVALKVASFPQNYDFEIEQLLQPPYLEQKLTPAEMEQELKNNVQGLLGYVVRWVQLGVGCSAIPNIHGVGLMEDRATLRISSQHIANWLYHKLITKEQVLKTFEEMCAFVNEQNKGVEGYTVLNPKDEECYSYKAAIDLVFEGEFTKNGYTEDILHRYRLLEKLKHKRPQSKL